MNIPGSYDESVSVFVSGRLSSCLHSLCCGTRIFPTVYHCRSPFALPPPPVSFSLDTAADKLNLHVVTHAAARHKCKTCGKLYSRQDAMTKHSKRCVRRVPCTTCGKVRRG